MGSVVFLFCFVLFFNRGIELVSRIVEIHRYWYRLLKFWYRDNPAGYSHKIWQMFPFSTGSDLMQPLRLIKSTCCLWKKAQSSQAVRQLKAQHDLIREKPKHCNQQRKGLTISC